ncbi:hypothetical protein ACJX0J_032504, partial [Zea mays]
VAARASEMKKHFRIGLHVEAFPYLSTCTKATRSPKKQDVNALKTCFTDMHCAHITRNTISIGRMSAKRKKIEGNKNSFRKNIMKKEKMIGENKAAQEAHEWKAQGTGAN